ncbi:MAG: sugar ABC transporter permease [Clostridiales bacterium]|nr:sugar ABC transporter permease [Clostridiales bacterium]
MVQSKSKFSKIEPYLYLLPAVILFGLFTFYPFFKTIVYSFGNTDTAGRLTGLAGLANYAKLLTDSVFLKSLGVTVVYSVLTVIFSMFIGVFLALMTSEKFPGHKVFRTVYALPMAVSASAAAAIFNFIFHPSIGILNGILGTKIGWLTDSRYALISVVIVTVWMNIGVNYIFALAAVQGVPQELYESATVDGAGALNKSLHVTLPCISPTLFFLLIINVIYAFQQYAQVKMMTSGGPDNSTRVLVYEIYEQAFMYGKFGYACAESVILFLILLLLTLAQFRLERKVTY